VGCKCVCVCLYVGLSEWNAESEERDGWKQFFLLWSVITIPEVFVLVFVQVVFVCSCVCVVE
jgi:hypothetical protein